MTGSRSASTSNGSAPPTNTAGPSATNSTTHWTLLAPIEIAKLTPLYGKFGIKLSTDNYVAWARVAQTALTSAGLFVYCNGDLPEPSDPGQQIYWKQADMVVQSALLTNMEPDVINQLDTALTSAQFWTETKNLYAGQSIADYTLTMSNLINTKYSDDQDVLEHITKLKRYHRDLILMNRDVPDDVFACFFRISMPPEWNYVFAGLIDPYKSKD